MLSIQKASKVCLLCRRHLFSKFGSRFSIQKSSISYQLKHSDALRSVERGNLHFYIRYNLQKASRCMSSESTNREADKLQDDISENNLTEKSTVEIETVVRQARQSFGDTLPKDFLTEEEYKLYERLFGPPIRETTGDDLEFVPTNGEISSRSQNVLLKTNSQMQLEEVEYYPEDMASTTVDASADFVDPENEPSGTEENIVSSCEENLDHVTTETNTTTVTAERFLYAARNQREADAMERLRKDMKVAEEKPTEEEESKQDESVEEGEGEEEETLEEDDEEDPYISSDAIRTHPHTIAGRSRSNPSTIHLPNKSLVGPITEMLTRTKPKHLQMAAEKAFGGKWLPYSSSVPSPSKQLPQKEIGLSASQYNMSEIEADAYISAVLPGVYVSIMSILIEIRKRLGQDWLRDLMVRDNGAGPRVLDAGSGGAGIIAWKRIMEAEWETMKDSGIVSGDFTSPGTNSVVVGSDCLRHRVSKLLENTTFLPRLPNYIHATNLNMETEAGSAGGRKMYDILIAPHTLLPQKENYRRKNMIKNLWTLVNPQGGILIILEKGIPRGFEAVAGARSLILDQLIASPGSRFAEKDPEAPESETENLVEKEEGMIVAPCTNHTTCPMYLNPGLSSGRKDYCYFPQRFIRPAFLQRLIGSKSRNHEDAKFSYVVFRRGFDSRKGANAVLTGDEATTQAFEGYEHHDLPISHQDEDYMKSDVSFNVLALPRAIFSPLKRHGHVTLDLCTPSGKLERWTVPKSFSKAAYRDARKSKWGDLWALGAKTRVPRNVRLGNVLQAKTGARNSDDQKVQVEQVERVKKKKIDNYDIILGDKGFQGIRKVGKPLVDRNEKRTKGGRLSKGPRPIGEDDL